VPMGLVALCVTTLEKLPKRRSLKEPLEALDMEIKMKLPIALSTLLVADIVAASVGAVGIPMNRGGPVDRTGLR
jgi:hypothetical protein